MPGYFEKKYKELFGEELTYDPIDITGDDAPPTPRLDLTDQPDLAVDDIAAPERSGTMRKWQERYSGIGPSTPADDNFFGEDTLRSLGAGSVDVATMALGGLEYAARQADQLIDGGVSREILRDLTSGLAGARRGSAEIASGIREGISQEFLDLTGREILTLDPERSIWRGGPGETASALWGKFTSALPATVITLLPAARLFRRGMTPGAITYLGASEGGLSLGNIANGIAEEIEGMSHEELLSESPYYSGLIGQGLDEAAAREELIAKGQGAAPLIGGIAVGVISATAGRYLEPIFDTGVGMSLARRAGTGFGVEAAQEAPQSGVEQVTQNIAAAIYDADRGITEGVAEAMAEGAIVGGLTGGGFSAVLGARPRQPEPPPDATGTPTPGRAPASFQEVFGTGRREVIDPETGQRGLFEVTQDGLSMAEREALQAQEEARIQSLPPSQQMDARAGITPAQRTAIANNSRQLDLPFVGQTDFLGAGTQREMQYGPPDQPRPSQPDLTMRVPIEGGEMVNQPFEPGGPLQIDFPSQPPPAPRYDGPEPRGPRRPTGDPRQGQLLTGMSQAAPDAPSAEPIADLQAQAAELQRPEMPREGVYLSASNVRNAQEQGALEQLLDAGVPIANFRENGDVLIARDEEVAESLVQLRDEGAPMQEILGVATGAGFGKPTDGVAVQRRDESGNVLQESLVPNEMQAERLFRKWQARYPQDETVIVTAPQAIKRRERRIKAERARPVIRGIEKEFKERRQRNLSAARLVGQAARAGSGLTTRERRENLAEAQRISPEGIKELSRELTRREATKSPTPVEQPDNYVDTDALEALSDRDIESLEGKKLARTFRQAAVFQAGRQKNVTIRYDVGEQTDGETEAQAAARADEEIPQYVSSADQISASAELQAVRTGGLTFKELLAAHDSPSLKKRLITRTRNQLKLRKHGGKVKTTKLTKEATEPRTGGLKYFRRKSHFDTQVLSYDVLKKDESRVDRRQRLQDLAKAKRGLQTATNRARKYALDRIRKGKFAEIAEQRDENGLFTDDATNMVAAKAYFRTILDYADALSISKHEGRRFIQEVQRVTEWIQNTSKMPAEDFSRVVGKALRAESQEQIRDQKGFDRDTKGVIGDPKKRLQANADQYVALMNQSAFHSRLNNRWRKNTYFNTLIAPLMKKFSDSHFEDGYPSYRPTEDEMTKLSWVMKNWKSDPDLAENFYEPLRRYFEELGFSFESRKKGGGIIIPRDEDGNYSYAPAEKLLNKLYAIKFGPAETDGGLRFTSERKQYTPEKQDEIKAAADRAADIEQFGRLAQANRIIENFRARVESPSITVPGLVRIEQRMIRAFKELGMWEDVSNAFGRIKFRSPRRWRYVGERLQNKTLRKDDARAILLKQMKTQPLPRDLQDDVAVRRRGEQEARAETEMFIKRYPYEIVMGRMNATEYQRYTDTKLAKDIVRYMDRMDERNQRVSLDYIIDLTGFERKGHWRTDVARAINAALAESDAPVIWDSHRKNPLDSDTWASTVWYDDADGARKRVVVLNEEKIIEAIDSGNGGDVIHALMHEGIHVVTQGAIERNPHIRSALETLRDIAIRDYRQRNPDGKLPYGLDTQYDVGEFVAEAFSNETFQRILHQIKFDQTSSLWGKFLQIVRRILGLSPEVPESVLDAIVGMEPVLFTNEMVQDNATQNLIGEPFSAGVKQAALDTVDRVNRARKRGEALRAPLILMTQRQLHKTFGKAWSGAPGENPFNRYQKAWEQRNSENTDIMEQGERVTRAWTAATEATGTKQALEFSRLITEATMHEVHLDVPASHVNNEHLSANGKAKHAELTSRFKQLDPVWSKLYTQVRGYYQRMLQRETDLMMLNALRGVLTSGRNAAMTRGDFDKQWNEESIGKAKLTDRRAIKAAFPQLDSEMVLTVERIAQVPSTRKGPYFPMMRYGEYVVQSKRETTKKYGSEEEARAAGQAAVDRDPTLEFKVKDTTLHITEFDWRTFENRTEAEVALGEMQQEYGAENTSKEVQLKSTLQRDTNLFSSNQIDAVIRALEGKPEAQNAIKEFWLRSLADSSFRKSQIRRKNRAGADFDLQHRNFSNYVKKAAFHISSLKWGSRMADAFTDMDKAYRNEETAGAGWSQVRVGQVLRELQKRRELVTNPTEISKVVRRGTELGQLYMLFSPSYWMVNATQPYMVTLPWLGAKYGWGDASASLAHAQKLIISPLVTAAKESWGGMKALTSKEAAEKAFNVLDDVKTQIKARAGDRADSYINMLDTLRRRSIIDLSWIAELRDIAEGQDLSRWQKVMDATRVMAHLTEVNNRILTAIAAYDLRYNEAIALPSMTKETAHEVAVAFATDAVAETQFDYSAGNKARLFQPGGKIGQVAPLVFQFMQWTQHMYALMIPNLVTAIKGGPNAREARRIVAGLMGTHAAAGGIIGMMFQPIKWAVGLAMYALGGDDDPTTVPAVLSGEAFDRQIRETMADLLGNELGRAASLGLPALVGADLSGRLSLGTVYYLDLRTDTAESTVGSLVGGLAGPVANLGVRALRGIDYARTGQWDRAAESLYPKVLRDLNRAKRYAENGLVNNAGDTIIQADSLSPYELFLQAIGFQPIEISEFYSRQALIKDTERYAQQRRSALLARFRNADLGERRDILAEVKEFNRNYPATTITRSSLLRTIADQKTREASFRRYGAALRGRAVQYSELGSEYE